MKSKTITSIYGIQFLLLFALQVVPSFAQSLQFEKDERNNLIITESYAKYIVNQLEFELLDGNSVKISDLKGIIVV
jgi:hypothetical protein